MPKRTSSDGPGVTPYQLFMLVLCAGAILSLAASTLWHLDTETQTVLDYADNVLCSVFFVDFLLSLYRAPKKWAYLGSWGWIDLLSSIPTIDALRLGRAARLLRILRVLRGVKSALAIAHFALERRAQSAVLATVLLTLLVLVFASIVMLHFEGPSGGNIQTAEDAMWWAVSTMTTVGYGDVYPTTPQGRLVAVFLMAAGIGLFATFSGLVASWFLSSAAAAPDSEVEELKAMVADVQRRLPPRNEDAT